MNWNQLQYIVTTAQEGSVTKAAARLFISQPSLTLSIQNLEKELGIRIFERSRGTLRLTYAGQIYYNWALSTLHSRVPSILPRFYELFPASEIFLEERPTYQLRSMLEEEKLDLIVDVPHPDSLNYQNILLAQEHLVLAVPESFIKKLPEISPEASMITMDPSDQVEGAVPIQLFAEFPFFMLAEPQNLSALSRRIYETAGFLPNTRLVCSSIATALDLSARGLGIVLAPEIYSHPGFAREGIRFFHMVPRMAGQIDMRQICLVYRKSLYLHAGLKALIGLFMESAPEIYGEGT